MIAAIACCWNDELRPLLAIEGIHFLDASQYRRSGRIWPPISGPTSVRPYALAFDQGHPFSTSRTAAKARRRRRSAGRHEVRSRQGSGRPAPLRPDPRAIAGHGQQGGETFAFLEDVVRLHLAELFPGVGIRSASVSGSFATPTSC
jgi:hypothetical protein